MGAWTYGGMIEAGPVASTPYLRGVGSRVALKGALGTNGGLARTAKCGSQIVSAQKAVHGERFSTAAVLRWRTRLVDRTKRKAALIGMGGGRMGHPAPTGPGAQ